MDQVSRRLSASVMMPVLACCRVLGQVKKSDGMVGLPVWTGGSAIGLSVTGACVAAVGDGSGVGVLAGDSDWCVDAGDHVVGMGGAWVGVMMHVPDATGYEGRPRQSRLSCPRKRHLVTACGRSGQERRCSAQAGDYWIVRLRGR